MEYDPSVWGPHYWFFLQSRVHLSELPTDEEKKKYYFNNIIANIYTQ